jgi:hypothetical protein
LCDRVKEKAVSLWWVGIAAYLLLIALFCAGWAVAAPPPQNSTKSIARFEQLRALRQLLSSTFSNQPEDPTLGRMLKGLDRVH